jgi:tRNA pseudouridine13 synthase
VTHLSPFSPPRFCPLPTCGGLIGPDPEHFIVEEIPAYPLVGSGEHVFLWVEKVGRNTEDVKKLIARAAGVRESEVGYAGMKDKNAVTRQWFSVCTKAEDAGSWDIGEGARVLSVTRHQNKLRTGHLIGNRFHITLVDVPENGPARAAEILAFLQAEGLPNYFGPQRFGREGRNLAQALAWVERGSRGTRAAPSPESPRSRKRHKGKRFENKLLPSVLQSEIFNRYVAARLARETPLLMGEVVRLDGTGKSFVVEDPAAELPRYQAKDLHRTGPMVGPKGLQAHSEARALEEGVCAELGLTEEDLTYLGSQCPGTRRDLMIYPEGWALKVEAPDRFVLSFSLPAGAYATQVIREFTGADFETPRGAPAEAIT